MPALKLDLSDYDRSVQVCADEKLAIKVDQASDADIFVGVE